MKNRLIRVIPTSDRSGDALAVYENLIEHDINTSEYNRWRSTFKNESDATQSLGDEWRQRDQIIQAKMKSVVHCHWDKRNAEKAQTEQETIEAATSTAELAMSMGSDWLAGLGSNLPKMKEAK